jgi:hypothetical protein
MFKLDTVGVIQFSSSFRQSLENNHTVGMTEVPYF